jgi:hypothetical protein
MVAGKDLKKFLRSEAEVSTSPAGLHWIFADNAAAKAQWSGKWLHFRWQKENELFEIENALAGEVIVTSDHDRWTSVKEGLRRQIEEVRHLLKVAGVPEGSESHPAFFLRERIHGRQNYFTYWDSIFNDWIWPKNEPSLKKLLPGPCVVVGGGSGRLALELAQHHDDTVLQVDINPLLSAIGLEIAKGVAIPLTEVPHHPRSEGLASKTHSLGLPETPGRPHMTQQPVFAVGNVSTTLWAQEVFSNVICPWVVDVIAEPFQSLALRLSSLLQVGGLLQIFGPLSFDHAPPHQKLSASALTQILKISGFGEVTSWQQTETYLNSDLESGHRVETVFYFEAKKTHAVPCPPPFHDVPHWIQNPQKNFHGSMDALDRELKAYAFEYEVLSGLKKGQSIATISANLASRSGMPQAEVEGAVAVVCSRLWESGRLK